LPFFLAQARGSLYELQTQIELARDLGFATTESANQILAESAEIASMMHGLMAALRQKR
jgi:four helix bundle protein